MQNKHLRCAFNLRSLVSDTILLSNCPGKGSFFELPLHTSQCKEKFGSLVIVFATHHEGGALFLRHRSHEWIFEPGQALASEAADRPSIGYLAFLNDIEQGVAPVTSGHCATMTFNLYFDGDLVPVSGKDAISKHLIPPKPSNQDVFCEALKALLENPEFMAEGGTLAFGLKHGYSIEHRGLQDVPNVLKGSDKVVWQGARSLGFEPMLYVYSDKSCGEHQGMVVHKLVSFDSAFLDEDEDDSIRDYIQGQGGIPVRQDGGELDHYDFDADEDEDLENPEPMEWVTPITTYSHIEDVYTSTGNPGIHRIHGDVCMILRIGKVGDRLAYPTAMQIEKAYRQSGAWWRSQRMELVG